MNENIRKWSGYWIHGNADPAPYLRKNFELKTVPKKAVLHLCGLGWHELYVNRTKADDRVLAPTASQFDRHVSYISYDVTHLLKQGKNAVAVLLGNGWYNCRTEEVWNFAHAPWLDNPKMICDLECDGKIVLSSDNSWKIVKSPITFNQLRNGEQYDARLETPGVLEPDFDDSGYENAYYCNPPGGEVVREEMEPCRICRTFEGVPREIAPNATVYDFGINLTGWCEIEVEGMPGTEICLAYGERIGDDGNLIQNPINQFVKSGAFQEDRYRLQGEGKEIWHPHFTYHGFQYCKVTIWNGNAKIHRLTAHFIHTDFRQTGKFVCSDAIANRLQECTVQSYLSNYTGIPTDCPHREKNGWTGDAELAMETGLWNFDCVKASANFLRILADTQRPSGQLPGIAPTAGFGYNWGNGPVWDCCLFEIPFRIREFTGDDSLIRQYLSAMELYMGYCRSMEHEGLVNFGLGDWNHYDRKHAAPTELVVSSFYLRCAERLAEFKPEYAETASRIAAAINRKYYHGNGIYADGQRTAMALSLYFGYDQEPELTIQRLVEAVRAKKHTAGFGIVGAKVVPRVLAEYGYADDAFTMLTQTEFPGWGYWVKHFNANTLFEAWRGTSSRNHIMYGDLSAWFYQYAAGIRPGKAGFRQFKIKPCFIKALDWVEAEHETQYGTVKVRWERKSGEIAFSCTVPAGTEAEIVLNGTSHKKVTGNFSQTFSM